MNFPPQEHRTSLTAYSFAAKMAYAAVLKQKGEPKNRANYKDAPCILLLDI